MNTPARSALLAAENLRLSAAGHEALASVSDTGRAEMHRRLAAAARLLAGSALLDAEHEAAAWRDDAEHWEQMAGNAEDAGHAARCLGYAAKSRAKAAAFAPPPPLRLAQPPVALIPNPEPVRSDLAVAAAAMLAEYDAMVDRGLIDPWFLRHEAASVRAALEGCRP